LQIQQEKILVQQASQINTYHEYVYTWGIYTEDALRQRRHGCFLQTLQTTGSQSLLLGHHLDDMLETAMLHILRGCHPSHICTMQYAVPYRRDPIYTLIRPLISIPKTEILARCDRDSIPYMIDASNHDVSISRRNYVRSVFLRYPMMKNCLADMIESMGSYSDVYIWVSLYAIDGWWRIDQVTMTAQDLYHIYQTLGIAINPRRTTLATLASQLSRTWAIIIYRWVQITRRRGYCDILVLQG
jgi:hypothetical protein